VGRRSGRRRDLRARRRSLVALSAALLSAACAPGSSVPVVDPATGAVVGTTGAVAGTPSSGQVGSVAGAAARQGGPSATGGPSSRPPGPSGVPAGGSAGELVITGVLWAPPKNPMSPPPNGSASQTSCLVVRTRLGDYELLSGMPAYVTHLYYVDDNLVPTLSGIVPYRGPSIPVRHIGETVTFTGHVAPRGQPVDTPECANLAFFEFSKFS